MCYNIGKENDMCFIKDNVIGRLCLPVTLFLITCSTCFAEDFEVISKDGEPWITLTGKLTKVNMTAIKGVWEEYAIELEDGELIILIGEKVGEFKEDMIGKKTSVSGVLKPGLRYAGNITKTVEVREINSE